MKVLVENPVPPTPNPGSARSFADLLLPQRQRPTSPKPKRGARPQKTEPATGPRPRPESEAAAPVPPGPTGPTGRPEPVPARPLELQTTPATTLPFPSDTLPGRPASLPEAEPELDLDEHLRSALFAELEREGEPTCVDPGPDAEPTVIAELDTAAMSPPPAEAPLEPAAQAPTAGPRAEAIAALVARIETCLREGQPCLKLGLSDRLGVASIEITRTAKSEVSVRVRARPGRRAAVSTASGEIAQALHARGLKLKDLEID